MTTIRKHCALWQGVFLIVFSLLALPATAKDLTQPLTTEEVVCNVAQGYFPRVLDLSATGQSAAFSGCSSAPSAPVKTHPRGGSALIGYWQDIRDDQGIIVFEPQRRIDFWGSRIIQTGRILDRGQGRMRLCVNGHDIVSRSQVVDGFLHLEDSGSPTARVLRRLAGPATDLNSQAMALPAPRDLAPEAIEEIQREVRMRFREDIQAEQAAFGTEIGSAKPIPVEPLARLKMIDVTSKNRKYLISLIKEIGWLDAERFGYATSNFAMLMVQHSGDRLLLESALPWIKRDVDSGLMPGGAYALVYDRLHLALGEKQRYATQIDRDDNDLPIVYPTEEPDKVDERRKALGLPPIAEYIKLFGGTEVRFSSECSEKSLRFGAG